MDINLMSQAIGTLGFPIVCVIGMAWFIYQVFKKTMQQQEANMKQVQERCAAREERLYIQMDKFSESLNSFNATLTKIDTRLEVVEEHILNNE